MSDPLRFHTLTELDKITELFCAPYDFEQDGAQFDTERTWTHNDKWFMSYCALEDVRWALCLN